MCAGFPSLRDCARADELLDFADDAGLDANDKRIRVDTRKWLLSKAHTQGLRRQARFESHDQPDPRRGAGRAGSHSGRTGSGQWVRPSREFAKVANNSDTRLRRCCSDQTQCPGEKARIDPRNGKRDRGRTRDPSSRWLSQQTGLPIDFEFQRSSVANKKLEAERVALGLYVSHGDARVMTGARPHYRAAVAPLGGGRR